MATLQPEAAGHSQQPDPSAAAFQASHWGALAGLWRQGLLCDVALTAAGGETLAAHSIVLASASGFFRALLCGAGRSMREGCAHGLAPAPLTGCATTSSSSSSGNAPAGQLVVELPYSAQQLSALLEVVYDHRLNVCGGNVTWLLDMAAYLEVAPLQEACCQFLRSAMSPETAVDVLLLAHHYHCSGLQEEGVQFLAQRLASLLLLPDARQALLRLPQPLLHALLASEALEVDQETELLCLLADWVCACPTERSGQLAHLLPLLQLSVLPQEQLTQHQLASCASRQAVALVQQLHSAARHCQGSSSAPGTPPQRRVHAEPSPQQHQSPSKQRKLMPAAELLGGSSGGSSASGAEASRRLTFAPQQQQPGNSSSGSCMWWAAGELVDANNHACSAVDQASAAATAQHPRSSSPALQPPTERNPSPALGASSSGSADIGSAEQPLWLLHEPGRVGAVLLEAWPGRQRGYQPSSIMVAGGHDPSWRGLKSVEVYDPAADTWSLGPMLPAALPFAGAAQPAKGELYVIGGPMCSSYMARLDAANQVWLNCEGPRLSRLHAAVAGASGLLYLTGGRTQVNQVVAAVEAYDTATASWQSLPDMLQPRYAHALVAQGGCLYALGGQASKAIHRTVEVFDAQRGSWQALGAELGVERKYGAAGSLGGRLVVLGGLNEARCRLSSIEAFDPREGRWASLTDMQCPRSSCSVACLGGSLYVMGGSAGDERLHSSVEVFDAAAGRWRRAAPLGCHRSGLTAAAI